MDRETGIREPFAKGFLTGLRLLKKAQDASFEMTKLCAFQSEVGSLGYFTEITDKRMDQKR